MLRTLSLCMLVVALPLMAHAQLIITYHVNVDGSNKTVQVAMDAINDYYSTQGDSETRTLVKVEDAVAQLYSDPYYHLELRVTTSNKEELCKVIVRTIHSRSANKTFEVVRDPECKDVSVNTDTTIAPRAAVTGGVNVVEGITDADVQRALRFAADEFNRMNQEANNIYYYKPVTVEQVTKQVVSGYMYHFKDVHMAETTCVKSAHSGISYQNNMLASCPLNTSGNGRVCDFDVWWQSWNTPEYKVQRTCKV